ncbi:MAG TPA: hypothetical protein VIB38_14300 [Aestuariivirgaceae bacterium]
MKRVSTYSGAVVLAAALIWPVTAETCGYHDPSVLARGILNWTYPKALYVGTAVWQAEASGVLPRPTQTPTDLFAYQRTVRHLQALGERLRRSRIAQGPGSSFSMVLLDSMLWTRFAAAPEGYAVEVHADGPAEGDVVLVTHGKVIRALAEGSFDAVVAEEYGLVRLYGPPASQERVRTILATTAAAQAVRAKAVTDWASDP